MSDEDEHWISEYSFFILIVNIQTFALARVTQQQVKVIVKEIGYGREEKDRERDREEEKKPSSTDFIHYLSRFALLKHIKRNYHLLWWSVFSYFSAPFNISSSLFFPFHHFVIIYFFLSSFFYITELKNCEHAHTFLDSQINGSTSLYQPEWL